MKTLESQFLLLINPDFVHMIEDKNGDLIGFSCLAPSLAKSMQKNRGRLFPFGWIPLLKDINNTEVLDMYFIAVRPDYQGFGVNAILMQETLKNCIKHGVKHAETGPELETNNKVQDQWKNFETEQHKRRRCWTKPII